MIFNAVEWHEARTENRTTLGRSTTWGPGDGTFPNLRSHGNLLDNEIRLPRLLNESAQPPNHSPFAKACGASAVLLATTFVILNGDSPHTYRHQTPALRDESGTDPSKCLRANCFFFFFFKYKVGFGKCQSLRGAFKF